VIGDGPVDLVFVPFIGNLAHVWELPRFRELFGELTRFSRLILLDKRGTGLSDRPAQMPILETRMDDLRAVLDAVGSTRTVLLGSVEGAQMTALYAATYPERTVALVLYNPAARMMAAPDYPWGRSELEWQHRLEQIRLSWGEREFLSQLCAEFMPSLAHDEQFRDWWVTHYRLSASPAAAHAFYRMWAATDIRHVLPSIQVPTLVLYPRSRQGPALDVAHRIPGALAVELPGSDDGPITTINPLVAEIERFLAHLGDQAELDRVLATVLFTDLVGSTEHAAAVGDRQWARLLAAHHAAVEHELARFRGRLLDTAGDGVFAAFEGPARAVRCACAIRASLRQLGLEVRAGLHTGECEPVGNKLGGIAVHIGARVASQAQPGQILVTSTVKDLVAGSGLTFDDLGPHQLKGVPGEWRLHQVTITRLEDGLTVLASGGIAAQSR
jgi:class 3 adenylate cyclase/pimeloyl-ACP methyl ester carboxylesterase